VGYIKSISPIFDCGIVEIDLEDGSQNREINQKPYNPYLNYYNIMG
jgi:hypothetical protein